MENQEESNSRGIDADPKNDPTYPLKKRLNGNDQTHYSKPSQQFTNLEVLQSIERPKMTAVFGTSVPPSGLSGKIRRFAFQYGEGRHLHWIPLLLADRVNVVEGILDDIRKGFFPNIFSERGMKASWKYDRKNLVKKTIITLVLSVVVLKLLRRKK